MVCGNGRDVSEVYVLTVMCYDVGTIVGCCAEFIPLVRSLEDCWFDVCLLGFY